MNMKQTIRNKPRRKNFNTSWGKASIKLFSLLLLSIFTIIISSVRVMAHCPLCTAATIIGVGVTRSIGLDDSIVGVFVGAMIISSALWINNLLKKKNVGGNNVLRFLSLIVLTTVLTYVSFYLAGISGPANIYRIFGMEKITFGALSGAIVSLITFWGSNKLKDKNEGKVLFNYQTIVITFAGLILNALTFWMVFR